MAHGVAREAADIAPLSCREAAVKEEQVGTLRHRSAFRRDLLPDSPRCRSHPARLLSTPRGRVWVHHV
ncbi:hypothetical protein GY45DRAFT_1325514 [Cubamyces sp. BRFM 1775]|nr:hypothetical protein GY45DRAFT_1325514 [Cubamyces sp. BRFM 1775]